MDATDWAIIGEIQRDARLSFNQIAKRVNLSAPSVAARIRRLEETGVIEGYHAQISPAAAGWPVAAFVQLHCHPGRCLLKTSAAENFPEIVRGEIASSANFQTAPLQITRLPGDSRADAVGVCFLTD